MLEYFIYLATLLGINVILASSLNIINGYCGLFSLGHAGFFAVGAYSSAVASKFLFPGLVETQPLLALVLAVVIATTSAAAAGLLVGIPCLRLTGDYLAIATVGFGEIIRIVILNMESVGASRGLTGIPKLTNIWIVLFFAALTIFLLKNMMRSSYGRNILAIRENEIAAQSMGVHVRFYKTFSFVVGSAFAGLAGALFAHNQEFLHPNNFNFLITVNILLMVVIGGLGSFRGAVLGAAIVTVLPEVLRFHETLSQMRMLVFAVVMILVMLFFPEGLMGLLKKIGKPQLKESSRAS